MPNQYSKITADNILRKVNRKRNPVSSLTQLAREFNVNTEFVRKTDRYGREGQVDHAVPGSFRTKVRSLVGDQVYNQIRA